MATSISIVIPVRNEAENISPLLTAIDSALPRNDFNKEIIFVNDCSYDDTKELLDKVCQKRTDIRVINFSEHCGQTAAIRSGIELAQYEIIVTMDGDLQHDPVDIPILIQLVLDGYDMATGWRVNRKDPIITKKIPSVVANKLISLVLFLPYHDYGCNLRVMRKKLALDLNLQGNMHRLLPAWSSLLGAKLIEVPIRHHPRQKGKSNYGLGRMFSVCVDVTIIFCNKHFKNHSL